MVQNDKKICLSCHHIIFISTIHHIFIYGTDVWNDNNSRIFVLKKKKKKNLIDKKLCLYHSISQEAFIIWSWFLVHVCIMITSPYSFFTFSKFYFSELLGDKRRRTYLGWAPTWAIRLTCLTLYHRNHASYDCGFWYTCLKWSYLQQFFFVFSKFWFVWFLGGGKKCCQTLYFKNSR